ncbi:MAG: hypothetical protein QOG30_1602, partial [Acidimicrobiaceae bacterium]
MASAALLDELVADELEAVDALAAELELLGAGLELLEAALGDELPHPAMTRPALMTTVETSFDRFTLSFTAAAAAEIARMRNFVVDMRSEPSSRQWWRWPRRRVAAVVMVLGVLALVPVVVHGVHAVTQSLTGPALAVPGRGRVHLDSGRWIIFERTSLFGRSDPRRGSDFTEVTIFASNVTVTSSRGTSFIVRDVTSVQTLTRGSGFYEAAVVFTVPAEDDYDIDISGVATTRALVARPVTDTLRDIALSVLLGILALIAAIVGLVFVVLPASAAPPPPPPQPPPPQPPPRVAPPPP